MMNVETFSLLHGAVMVAVSQSTANPQGLARKEVRLSNKIASIERREQFITGRSLAQHLFRQIGIPNLPILKDRKGAPIWPCGIEGSISHTQTYAAAAIVKASAATPSSTSLQGIGIDIEELQREISPGILPKVLTETEQRQFLQNSQIHPASKDSFPLEARIIFSLKEAAYKCMYPLVQEYFGFFEAEITSLKNHQATINLSQKLQDKGCPKQITGGWKQEENYILTWAVR